ncbi:MAG: 4-hydroxy-tetrahydrodipicolinate synthase [Dehalococcoidia bacterium]|nr:4-hydroxy-tetrahydrodipicolinate synthase [Dehalococcoidia bacterium]
MAEFGRLLTAMVTPMTASGEVDDAACAELARALVASGTDGIVATGTTGEAPTLTPEEQVRVWRTVKRAVGPAVAVIAGATNNSTAQSIEMTREAERAGLDGVLLTVPAYNKPTQEGLVRHFTAIAEATTLPGLLYNVPGRTSLNMSADTTIRLSQVPGIVGVKEASGDLGQIARIIEHAASGFRVWSGNDSDTLPVLAIGGYGVVSVAAHLVGWQICELIAACVAGSNAAAAEIHRRLLPLVDVLFVESNPIPTKCALNALGFAVGDPRLPLLPASAGAAERISAELARHRIDLPLPVKR